MREAAAGPSIGSRSLDSTSASASALTNYLPAHAMWRTPEMTRIARFYEYGPGTSSPAGQYVEVASELIVRDGLGELEAARVYAVLGMAMADAGIVAWRAKYVHWMMRPSQADQAITMPIALPNFPAYPSGHSSFSGAAEVVLSAFFPADAGELHRFAEENGWSQEDIENLKWTEVKVNRKFEKPFFGKPAAPNSAIMEEEWQRFKAA